MTQQLNRNQGTIAYTDHRGDGPLMVMLPGAGNIREEYRFLAPPLRNSARVVTADLRGHGDSSSNWPRYGMTQTAGDLIALLEHLDSGPATVVATSFSPTAALWAAAERPDLISSLVLISAHLDPAPAWQRSMLSLLLRGPLSGTIWAGQFRKWHPGAPPADLDAQADGLSKMMNDRDRRRAVRETLTANRDGLDARIDQVSAPTLVVMGGADSHFKNPTAEGQTIAAKTGGSLTVVPEAGHYPHVEYPGVVAAAIEEFLTVATA